MFRVIDKRGSGKTSRLMLLAKENNGTLVCANPNAMHQKAIAYGLTGFDIISYKDFNDKHYDARKPCFIDELEEYIKIYGNVLGYSLTLEDECV